MPDVVKILMSKTDMSKEEITKLSSSDAWKLVYSIRNEKAKSPKCIQICFTGFGVTEKEELIAKIEFSRSFKKVSSVTKELDYLVCGENAGPAKMAKAEQQGVQLITVGEYKHMVETGELLKGE